MITLDKIRRPLETIKSLTADNNHLGALRTIAAQCDDIGLDLAIESLAKLARQQQGISGDLRPIRDYIERATLDTARRTMTPDAFEGLMAALRG